MCLIFAMGASSGLAPSIPPSGRSCRVSRPAGKGRATMGIWRVAAWVSLVLVAGLADRAWAQTLNVYTAWPESLSQPIFKAYTAKSGVQVNFIRLSTGELVARATAEKNNPRADVIWGAPGDGFAAAKEAGILEPYRPPTWDRLPAELKDKVQVYTKSGGGCTIPASLGQAIVCIAHLPDAMEAKKKGYDMVVTFPKEGVAAVIEAVALVKGAKNRELATKFIDWTFSRDMQDLLDKNQVYMLPTLPGASVEPSVQSLMKEAKLLPVDLDWVGKNRKRLVERWVNEVIKE